MSDDIKYEIQKRIWLAQPRRRHGWKSHWSVRPVNNYDVTRLEVISPPMEFVGNGHEPYQLYYHVSEVKKLAEDLAKAKMIAEEFLKHIKNIDPAYVGRLETGIEKMEGEH